MNYTLSEEADRDLDDILEYGSDQFGIEKASAYLFEIEQVLFNISEMNRLGRTRNDLKPGLHCFPFKSHLVFYQIQNKTVRVVIILHGSVDLPTYLKLDF